MSSQEMDVVLIVSSSDDDEDCIIGETAASPRRSRKRKRVSCLSDDDSVTDSSESADGKEERSHQSFFSSSSDEGDPAKLEGANFVEPKAHSHVPMTMYPHANLSASGGAQQDSIVGEQDSAVGEQDHAKPDERGKITIASPSFASQPIPGKPEETSEVDEDSSLSGLKLMVECIDNLFGSGPDSSDSRVSQQSELCPSTVDLDKTAQEGGGTQYFSSEKEGNMPQGEIFLKDLVACQVKEILGEQSSDENGTNCIPSALESQTERSPDIKQARDLIESAGAAKDDDSISPQLEGEDRFRFYCGSQALFLDENPKQKKEQLVIQGPECDFYGMPSMVQSAIFDVYGIAELHPWQQNMLREHISLEGGKKNALIHAPTSGGKTLVALILIMRTMFLEKSDGILVLPYVAIVTEKVQELKVLASKVGFFTVAEYAGSKGIFPIPKKRATLCKLYVCTPEKASIAWRFLCGERSHEIGLVALDECHMISDGSRGSVVEELFVSILKWAPASLTLLALSATIGNVEDFRVFLGGGNSSRYVVYDVHSRPTSVHEYLVVSGMSIPIARDRQGKGMVNFTDRGPVILDNEQDAQLLECKALEGSHEDAVVSKLVIQCMKSKESALVFCSTRKMCVSMCRMLTTVHQSLESNEKTDVADCDINHKEVTNQRALLIGHLKNESRERVDPTLIAGIAVGIGYHSAELHPTERSAVEDAFKRGILAVLCCTTTLAAGVNLPCSRVIIRSPWTGNRFLSCAQYLQMSGRAGRTGFKTKSGSLADCYVLLQPNDAGKFQQLVEQHVESLQSQLGVTPSHYIRSRPMPGHEHEFTGITRVLLHSLSVDERPVQLSHLLDLYRMTLFYQMGTRCEIDGKRTVIFTHGPFLTELQRLLNSGHVRILRPETDENNIIELTVKTSSFVEPSLDSLANEHEDTSTLPADLKDMTPDEMNAFSSSLTDAMQHPEAKVQVVNYLMTLSPIARASSAASLEVSDAEKFIKEAQALEEDMCLKNPFTFLYLSLTEGTCKPLMEDPQYREKENTKNARKIGKMLASNFDLHPDAKAMKRIGLDSDTLMEWVVGNPTVRNNSRVTETLTRVWTAMFLKDLVACPDNADKICFDYGFERSKALELSVVLVSRLQNLRTCCQKLEKFWWYPPMSTHISKLLGPECAQDIRPLLEIRHVTIERAKKMFTIGLKTVQDVAQVYPPTLLSDQVPHTGKWMAVEMVLHARMLVAEEAALFEAESIERRRMLQ